MGLNHIISHFYVEVKCEVENPYYYMIKITDRDVSLYLLSESLTNRVRLHDLENYERDSGLLGCHTSLFPHLINTTGTWPTTNH